MRIVAGASAGGSRGAGRAGGRRGRARLVSPGVRARRATDARGVAAWPGAALSVLCAAGGARSQLLVSVGRARRAMNELASLSLALAWTERLTALALALQSVELLQLRRAWSDTGGWRWELLAPEHRSLFAPLRWLLAALLPARSFAVLLGLRLLATLALGAGLGQVAPFLLLAQVAIGVRFRGTFNGGSDAMSVVLLAALSL